MLIYVQYFGCLGSICISTPRPVEMRGYFPHTTPTQVKWCEQTSFMKLWFPSPFWQFKFKPNYSTFFGLEDLVSAFAIILLYSSRVISIFYVKLSIRARDKDLGSGSEDKISDPDLAWDPAKWYQILGVRSAMLVSTEMQGKENFMNKYLDMHVEFSYYCASTVHTFRPNQHLCLHLLT